MCRFFNFFRRKPTYVRLNAAPAMLPILEATMPDDGITALGVNMISLVRDPAIQTFFVALKAAQADAAKVKFIDAAKKQLVTPILIPNQLIYRKPPEVAEECYVRYSAELIEQVQSRFSKNQHCASWNIDHAVPVQGVYITQQWLTTENDSKAAEYGFTNIPKGTWMAVIQIENEQLWNEVIQTGYARGVSIEGFFLFSPTTDKAPHPANLNQQQPAQATYNQELSELKQSFDDMANWLKTLFGSNTATPKVNLLFAALTIPKGESYCTKGANGKPVMLPLAKNTAVRLAALTLEDGSGIVMDDSGMCMTAEGAIVPDGKYKLADGQTLEVMGGYCKNFEDAGDVPPEQVPAGGAPGHQEPDGDEATKKEMAELQKQLVAMQKKLEETPAGLTPAQLQAYLKEKGGDSKRPVVKHNEAGYADYAAQKVAQVRQEILEKQQAKFNNGGYSNTLL